MGCASPAAPLLQCDVLNTCHVHLLALRYSWYYIVVYCLYQFTTTCWGVPYSALTMEISENSIERDSATAWRMTSELLATSLGVVLFGLVLAQLAPEGSSTDAERRVAYFAGSLVVCCFVVVPGFIATCCVPERPEYCTQPEVGSVTSGECSKWSNPPPSPPARGFFGEWLAGLKLAFSCPSYLVLMLCFLCSGLTFQLTSNNLNLYLRHTLDVADQFQIIVSHSRNLLLYQYSMSTQHLR